ncbi:MAG TPA: hypothetical protein VES38_10030 [Methylotenera sp.]|nr:hypothetical protein [Methylotenera sp.]
MSKINPLQAAALSSTVVKTDVAKKTDAIKPVTAKTVAAKPATARPIPAAVAAKAAPKKAVKAKVVKVEKEKPPKLKMERDSFTMPKAEYAQFYVLKERLVKLGQPAKKSELLRAGIMQLTAMTDAALKAAMAKVPAIKTGRPKKK